MTLGLLIGTPVLAILIGLGVSDVVVLSEDPHVDPKVELERINVLMVVVGGTLEVCAPSVQTLCPA